MKITKLVAAVAVVLALAACDPTKKGGGTRQLTPADQYRACVGTNHNKQKQNTCQAYVWGKTFSDDDENWVCDAMGDWKCGPTEKRL